MRLWLARHAAPLVAGGTCYGQLDVAADAAATQSAARRLAAVIPAGTPIAASPLRRCRQLAEALHGMRPDLAFRTDPRLQEMNFGAWEGQAWQAIGEAALQAWTDDFASHAAGGSGESVDGFMARVGEAFDELANGDGAPPDVLWITHAGVIRAVDLLRAGTRRITAAGDWPTAAPDYGQWHVQELPEGLRDGLPGNPRRPVTTAPHRPR